MKFSGRCALALVAGLIAGGAQAQAEQFASAHAPGHCLASSANGARIEGCVSRLATQGIAMRYIPGENVFFGPLSLGGQCLEARGQGQPLVFTTCRAGPAQEWKLTGATGVLNNGQGMCADLPNGTRKTGSPVIAWPCNNASNQKWLNARYRTGLSVTAIPGMKPVAPGTALQVVNGNIVAGGAGNIVAAGAGNMVAGGAGNIVAGGAGNIVAGGAGN